MVRQWRAQQRVGGKAVCSSPGRYRSLSASQSRQHARSLRPLNWRRKRAHFSGRPRPTPDRRSPFFLPRPREAPQVVPQIANLYFERGCAPGQRWWGFVFLGPGMAVSFRSSLDRSIVVVVSRQARRLKPSCPRAAQCRGPGRFGFGSPGSWRGFGSSPTPSASTLRERLSGAT